MQYKLATFNINAQTLTAARERARQVGELFGLETIQRTRFVTAVSEVARHAVQRAGESNLVFLFDTESRSRRLQCLLAQFTNLDAVGAEPTSPGIAAARRLVDHLGIESSTPGGAMAVTLEMSLARGHKALSASDIQLRVDELARSKALSPMEELEQQNREMVATLEELRRRQLGLEQADVRKNEFMVMLAHELRSPLATLKLSIELLRRQPDMAQLLARCEVMGRQTGHMVRLVDDLTDATRVEKGKVELLEAPVEVNGLVRDALEMTSSAILQRGHAVALTEAPTALWLQGDAARLLQVFSNVIQNAAKYTPPNGRIAIAVRDQGQKAVVEVSDNGVGIEAEMLPHVFGLFVQARHRSSDAAAGLGVGLTLADRLVREHGGSISAQSQGPGHGSQFTITLPLMSPVAS
jgi:signal transduction histidine kinase